MKNSRKMKKWGCVMLALMSGLMLPGIVQANSGLSDTPQTISIGNYYVGIKGASGNEVIIDSDLNAGAVGGYADSDSGDVEAKDNRVAVKDSTVKGNIYGGQAYSMNRAANDAANADSNSVTVNGGTVGGNIYGGQAYSQDQTATANSNSVTLSGGTVEDIYGGQAYSMNRAANADSNSVTVNGGTVGSNIYGGRADSDQGDANANSNSVTVNDGTVGGNIYGGQAYSMNRAANADSNSVTVNGGTVGSNIYGGRADSDQGDANANSNSVTVNGGTVGGNIYGGQAYSMNRAANDAANADSNSVTVNGGTVEGNIYSGYAYSRDGTATANSNSVIVNGGTVGGNIYGGQAYSMNRAANDAANADSNSVTVNGGTVEGNIYSGYAYSRDGTATANSNSVIVNGGTVGLIEGGHAFSYEDGTATANDNSVTVNDSTVKGSIYGGYAVAYWGGTAKANDNSVTISGGTVTGEVYGGYVEVGTDSTVTGSTVTGNSITLSGTADVSGASLYGGVILTDSGTDIGTEETVKNNNLIINGWSGAVKRLNNFDQIQVKALAGGLDLAAGKRTVFVNTAEGIHGGLLNPTEAKEMQAGVALTVSGNMGISKDNKDIYINVAGVRVRDQTVIAVESRAASVAAVGRGAEAVTDSLDTIRGSEEGLSTFASIIGSRSRYNTGSHADVNGWNGIVGTAWTRELTSGTLSYGAFYENGGGSYDTHNTINGRTYRGDGDTVYNGGGLLLRWETNGGTYTEASLRAGMVKNEVGPSLEFAGNRYGFKTENNYYGGHVGIGRIMERDDGDAWDIYGKYFHMHHEGDTVTIAGDEFAFDSVNSDRLRVGARYLDRKNGRFTGYYGLAYEYEFSGDTGGTANHHAMYTPSLQGSTVIGEIGFRGTPGENSPWSFEVSLRGYAGKQEGISGAVTAAYSF